MSGSFEVVRNFGVCQNGDKTRLEQRESSQHAALVYFNSFTLVFTLKSLFALFPHCLSLYTHVFAMFQAISRSSAQKHILAISTRFLFDDESFC